MSKLINFIKDNKTDIIIGTSIGLVIFGAIKYVIPKLTKEKVEVLIDVEQKDQEEAKEEQKEEIIIKEEKKEIELLAKTPQKSQKKEEKSEKDQFSPNKEAKKKKLTLFEIQQCFEKIVVKASVEYKFMILTFRGYRRALEKTDYKTYFQYIDQFLQQSEKILQKALEQVLKENNLTNQEFEDEIKRLAEQNENNMQMLFLAQAMIPQRLKLTMNGNSDLSLKEVKTALNESIKFVEEEFERLRNIVKDMMVNQDNLVLFLQWQLHDSVFEKTKIEEEDIGSTIIKKGMNQNQEVLALLKKYEQKMMAGMGQPQQDMSGF